MWKHSSHHLHFVRALWKVGSLFAEASSEVALKQMANTFSLKYQLETDNVYSVFIYPENGQTQFASLPWHIHICTFAKTCLASFAALFKGVSGLIGIGHTSLTQGYLLFQKSPPLCDICNICLTVT